MYRKSADNQQPGLGCLFSIVNRVRLFDQLQQILLADRPLRSNQHHSGEY